MSFINAVKNTLNEDFNYSVTENGALGYRTSGKELVDLNFAVSSMRGMSESEICKKFTKAYAENPVLAMRWLFFARDCRMGIGERRLFRVIIKDIANNNPTMGTKLIPIVAEYGREDDLWVLLDTPCKEDVILYCKNKLNNDIDVFNKNSEVKIKYI